MEIRKGDTVQIIAGKDKGKKGQVIKGLPSENKVVVEGVNIVSKAVRAKKANEQGGIVKQPAALDASNVMIICPACGKMTRIAHNEVDGKNARICKKCGASLDAKPVKAKAAAKKKAVKKDAETAANIAVETEAVEEVKAPAKKAPAKKAPAKTETEVK